MINIWVIYAFIAAILSSIFLKENPDTRTWIIILLCFSFILFIFYDSYEGGRLFGDLMALATACLVACSSVIIRYGKVKNFLRSLFLAKFLIAFVAFFFIQEIIFIGFASLTFLHILLEYLIEKNE